MPVIVKDFTWAQSEGIVSIRIPLKGKHCSDVDIIISSNYLKLNYKPFLCEIFLSHRINYAESKCTFTTTEAVVNLTKEENMLWEKLELNLDKKEQSLLKQKIIEEIQIREQENIKEKNKLKDSLQKYAVSEAIELDRKKRERINKTREEDLKTVLHNFETQKYFENKNKISNIVPFQGTKEKCSISEIPNSSINEAKKPQSEFSKRILTEIKTRQIPPIRSNQTITFSFTERKFTTPKRESCEETEKEYLKKINEARRATGFISEDLRPEEQDPEWCKRKGDELLRTENYLGAISAYSHGIKLSKNLPSLYSNRAVAHFMIGNYEKCVHDCSEALELLHPVCEANLDSRVKCIVRRAASLTRLGMLSKGIDEMKAAIKLQPNNDKLKQDLYQMERAWEQDPDSE